MPDLTDEELAELRKLGEGGKETALEWRAAVLAAHPFLLAEVQRRRREMESMIPVRSYRCKDCDESVPDNLPKVEEHLRSERHLAAKRK